MTQKGKIFGMTIVEIHVTMWHSFKVFIYHCRYLLPKESQPCLNAEWSPSMTWTCRWDGTGTMRSLSPEAGWGYLMSMVMPRFTYFIHTQKMKEDMFVELPMNLARIKQKQTLSADLYHIFSKLIGKPKALLGYNWGHSNTTLKVVKIFCHTLFQESKCF